MASSGAGTAEVRYVSRLLIKAGEAKKAYEGSIEVPWDPGWFEGSSDDYSPDLAVASMALALATYGNTASNDCRFVRDTLDAMGFLDADVSSYAHRTEEDPSGYQEDPNVVAYAFAHRRLGEDAGRPRYLVAVAVRGTVPTVEWESNGNVADSVADGDYGSVRYHEGFKRAEEELLGQLKGYLDTWGIDGGSALVWVAGHSRGAAVANILAAELDEGALGFDASRVFAYAFASPRCTRRPDAQGPAFSNVFNVVNPEDYIPRMPLEAWGFQRFGRTYYLPSVATAHAAFQKTREGVDEACRLIAGADFEWFGGIADTDAFVRYAADLCPTLADLYGLPHFCESGGLTFRDYLRDFTSECARHGLAKREASLELARRSRGAYAPLFSYFFHDQVVGKAIAFGHASEGYLAKLVALGRAAIDVRSLGACDTRRFTVYGRADVVVRNAQGAPVALIAGGAVDKPVAGRDDALAVWVDKDARAAAVWVPTDGTYDLQVAFRGPEGRTVDCTWATQDPEGTVQWQEAYRGISLEPNVLTGWPDVVAKGAAASVSRGGDCAVSAAIVGDGDAVGAVGATAGDHVGVRAFHGPLVRFEGWYEGNACDGDPVSRDAVYVFDVTGDRALTAVFRRL